MMFSILRHWHCLLSLSSLWLPPALRNVNIQSIGYHSAWTRVILPSNNYGFLLCLSAALLFPTPFSLFSHNFFSSLLMIFPSNSRFSSRTINSLCTENRTDEQWKSSLPTVQRNKRSKFIIFFYSFICYFADMLISFHPFRLHILAMLNLQWMSVNFKITYCWHVLLSIWTVSNEIKDSKKWGRAYKLTRTHPYNRIYIDTYTYQHI